MRFAELEPRWIHPNLFVFLCPHCRKDFLSCKIVVMSMREQFDIFQEAFGEDWNTLIVPCKESEAWKITSRDFGSMTVTPSIDASASGHWHGHITAGEIK